MRALCVGKRLGTFVMDSLDGRVHGSEGENKALREGEVGGGGGSRKWENRDRGRLRIGKWHK